MVARLALVGGDEFRRGCEEMDAKLLEVTGVSNPKVVVIPTAAVEGSPAKAASNGVEHFSKLGADASPLMALDGSDANNESIVSPVDLADVIYISGGNPDYLLNALRDSLLLDRIKQALERGAILAGSSAGAMVMGSWMRFRTWKEALGIADGVVTFPHHESAAAQGHQSVSDEIRNSAPSGMTVLGIDGMTGCLGSGNEWTVLGSGSVTVYANGEWKRYASGESFNFG